MAVDWVSLALQAGGILVIVLIVAVIAAIFGVIFIAYKKSKLYKKYKVLIWKRYKTEGGKTIPLVEDINEKGAVIKDKKMNKWVFHLKNANIDLGEEESVTFDENRELDIPTTPYAGGGEVVFLEKVGNKKYAMGTPYQLDGNVTIKVSEADVAEAKRSYALFVKTFGKKANPIWAFAMYVIFAVLILVLIFIVLNKFELIVQASENFAKASPGAGIPSPAPG